MLICITFFLIEIVKKVTFPKNYPNMLLPVNDIAAYFAIFVVLNCAAFGESGVLPNKTDSDQSTLDGPIVTTPAAICPPNAELVAGVCKCNEDLCAKPSCDKILNQVKKDSQDEENCCPVYTCDDCIDKFLVDGKCICPENSSLNKRGICECSNRYESVQNNTCQCDLNKCPLPNLCDDNSVGISQFTGCCTFIECKLCPDDSYPKRYNSDLIEDKCVCNICPETSCENGYIPKHIKVGHNIPGDCCDVYECVPIGSTDQKDCFINYSFYVHMESWVEDECRNCTCINGETICTSENSNARCRGLSSNTMPDKYCIVNDTIYQHFETWWEDECTNCTCINGKPKCVAHFCNTKVSVITPECPFVNCKKFCKYGFKSNKKGCQICKCRLPEKINKEMEMFMHSHNLTDDDVLVILRMYMKNKHDFEERKLPITTTEITNEVYRMPPKYEHLEMFMYNHNLTEMDALEMLDVHLQNRQIEVTPETNRDVSVVSSTPKAISYTDNTHWWAFSIAGLLAFLIGFVLGWILRYYKQRFRGHEKPHNNNNVSTTKSQLKPKEKAIYNNEKKPLTNT